MWVIGLPEARWITPYPARHPSTLCALRAQAISQLKAKSGREGRRRHHFCQLEEKLSQFVRPTNQAAEVFHFVGGEDSRRRVLCPWRAHPLASTLPAVARATAGRFMRCEWLVGRGVGASSGSARGFCVSCSPHG